MNYDHDSDTGNDTDASDDIPNDLTWHNNILCGSLAALSAHRLPPAPTSAAPFNAGEWTLDLERRGGKYVLKLVWAGMPRHYKVRDLYFDFILFNGADQARPPLLRFTDDSASVAAGICSRVWPFAKRGEVEAHLREGCEPRFQLEVDSPCLVGVEPGPAVHIPARLEWSEIHGRLPQNVVPSTHVSRSIDPIRPPPLRHLQVPRPYAARGPATSTVVQWLFTDPDVVVNPDIAFACSELLALRWGAEAERLIYLALRVVEPEVLAFVTPILNGRLSRAPVDAAEFNDVCRDLHFLC